MEEQNHDKICFLSPLDKLAFIHHPPGKYNCLKRLIISQTTTTSTSFYEALVGTKSLYSWKLMLYDTNMCLVYCQYRRPSLSLFRPVLYCNYVDVFCQRIYLQVTHNYLCTKMIEKCCYNEIESIHIAVCMCWCYKRRE